MLPAGGELEAQTMWPWLEGLDELSRGPMPDSSRGLLGGSGPAASSSRGRFALREYVAVLLMLSSDSLATVSSCSNTHGPVESLSKTYTKEELQKLFQRSGTIADVWFWRSV